MTADQLKAIANRWEGTADGHRNLTFSDAKADMEVLLAAAQLIPAFEAEIRNLKAHVRKRNADMQAFASEVSRLANQKYSDYMDLGKDAA